MLKQLVIFLIYLTIGISLGVGLSKGYAWLTEKPAYVTGDHTKYFANKKSKVVLFGTSWCRYCAKTRMFFNKLGIEYQDYDIETSENYRAMFKELGGGPVPMILIDNIKIQGFRANLITQFLNDKGISGKKSSTK